MTVKTDYATYENCYPRISRYVYGDTLAIQIWNDEDGAILNLTTNLTNEVIDCDCEQFVDTNNFPGAIDFIKEYKLGTETGILGHSGFCTYPLVRFDLQRLAQLEAAHGAE